MVTEEEIIAAAIAAYSQNGAYYPIAMRAFASGAQWANEQNAAEIAEMLEMVSRLKNALDQARYLTNSEGEDYVEYYQQPISDANDMLEKYGKR